MFASGETAPTTDPDPPELDIDVEPAVSPLPSVTPEEDQGLAQDPVPDLIEATKVLMPTHTEVHETHASTLKTEVLDVLLDSLESVSPTSQQELSQAAYENPAGTLSQVPLRDTLIPESLHEGHSELTSGKEVIHLADPVDSSRTALHATLIGCTVLLLVGLCSSAFLRHKLVTRLHLEPPTLESPVSKRSSKRKPRRKAAYNPSVPFKPFPSCLPPTTVEEARHTNCIYLVPSTEEDRFRSARNFTLSFLREAPFGAPVPLNSIPLFMERRVRPLWQYPTGNYHSPIVNVPIPQVASPAIRIANTGIAGPSAVSTRRPINDSSRPPLNQKQTGQNGNSGTPGNQTSETRPSREGEDERSECDTVAELLVGKSRK